MTTRTLSLTVRRGLTSRGAMLAAVQIVQIGSGVLGQILLLARWSPHVQTDLFVLFSSVPFLLTALVLVGGLEMAFPASYHRILASEGDAAAQRFTSQIARLSLLAGFAASVVAVIVVWLWSQSQADMPPALHFWLALATGAQALPVALMALWRGALIARDQLMRMRFSILAMSALSTLGYALLPGPPALTLALTALAAACLSAFLAWYFWRQTTSTHETAGASRWLALPHSFRDTFSHPELRPLARALLAQSASLGLVHLQALAERSAVAALGVGYVAALNAAGRGWDAVNLVVVAACVLPVFPLWAQHSAHNQSDEGRRLLRQSLKHTLTVSLPLCLSIGIALWLIGPLLETRWHSGTQAAHLALLLLPRTVLTIALQPFVHKYFAQGTPWPPVIGAFIGIGITLLGILIFVPSFGLEGLALTLTIAALPNCFILGWREWQHK